MLIHFLSLSCVSLLLDFLTSPYGLHLCSTALASLMYLSLCLCLGLGQFVCSVFPVLCSCVSCSCFAPVFPGCFHFFSFVSPNWLLISLHFHHFVSLLFGLINHIFSAFSPGLSAFGSLTPQNVTQGMFNWFLCDDSTDCVCQRVIKHKYNPPEIY